MGENTHLFASNDIYIEELFAKYLANPNDVDSSWHSLFLELKNANNSNDKASWNKVKSSMMMDEETPIVPKLEKVEQTSNALFKAYQIIEAYRAKGHMLANLDPLNLEKKINRDDLFADFKIDLSKKELDTQIDLKGKLLGITNITVNSLINLLSNIYAKNIGTEFTYIEDTKQKQWIQNALEELSLSELSVDEKKNLLTDLAQIEGFEEFLHVKFPGTKRFSVEGGASSIIAIEEFIAQSAKLDIGEIVIGMAHRGRLNVLTKVMGKTYHAMLSEFQGNLAHPEETNISGDVKYHLGFSSDKEFNGKKLHLSLVPNPSHLETVNPVVAGKVRSIQDLKNDIEREKVAAILIHGDAAFSGQGVVAESLSLSDLEGYKTGGIIHIIVNNQIGFTTNPKNARTGRYPTEFAKIIQAPIFHVNGDDPEAVINVTRIASLFRHKFKKDVIIDVVCYRLYGHNEGDEPFFTQPIMYNAISKHQTTTSLYASKLVEENIIAGEDLKNIQSEFRKFLSEEYNISTSYKPLKAEWLEDRWIGLADPRINAIEKPTGVKLEKLKKLGVALTKPNTKININNKVKRQLEAKEKMLKSGENLDWAMGEALAFASLLSENIKVRVSGQDVSRGTFSHRHSVLIDQNSEEKFVPLNNLGINQALYEVVDSNLSEYAVLGYEYGYSLAHPNSLVIWEAQFGDFSNGAQIIIDQYISSAESKWLKMSGIVMLLPHGYEGQGPEHSSARLERYLQLCAKDNIIIANCTTPASLFHILRRQVHRNYRKPLIIMSPKSLLRHKLAVSNLSEFESDTFFKPVIAEVKQNISNVRKILFCSGKIYYDLIDNRDKNNISDIAIIRLEQLYPFSKDEVITQINNYPDSIIAWVQEEPKNMGAYYFIKNNFEDILDGKKLEYYGRDESASPATGYKKIHDKEQDDIINRALGK